jgi:hypothetical protein
VFLLRRKKVLPCLCPAAAIEQWSFMLVHCGDLTKLAYSES